MHKKIISILLVGLSAATYGQFAFAQKTFCDGKPANIIGTSGDDKIVINDDNTYTINGGAPIAFTPPAIVYGGNGSDRITGSSFNDIICGGNQADTIIGRDGNDRIFGQNSGDKLYGDSTDATNSCVSGGGVSCNDYVLGGNGKDYIQGGDGNDDLEGENAPDVIDGGLGNDLISGGYGQDTCTIEPQVDTVDGCELNP